VARACNPSYSGAWKNIIKVLSQEIRKARKVVYGSSVLGRGRKITEGEGSWK
jgi:hypothetical protein